MLVWPGYTLGLSVSRSFRSQKLDDYIVELIFYIFDVNDDGKLSYKEFLAVMNDRLHRGLKVGLSLHLSITVSLRSLVEIVGGRGRSTNGAWLTRCRGLENVQ